MDQGIVDKIALNINLILHCSQDAVDKMIKEIDSRKKKENDQISLMREGLPLPDILKDPLAFTLESDD